MRDRRCSIYKIDVEPKFLLGWFLKSLLASISKHVSMYIPQTNYLSILKAQTFELIYTQFGYLYTMLLHARQPTSSTTPTPDISHPADGLIGSMHQQLGPFPL